MPPDNPIIVFPGSSIQFPQNGPASGGITRIGPIQFNLPDIGVYQVMFEVAVTEPGQLVVTVNGTELPQTLVGRGTGTSQIVGLSLITTTVVNSIITIRNPVASANPLTITPLAGGGGPVSAHLIITKLQ